MTRRLAAAAAAGVLGAWACSRPEPPALANGALEAGAIKLVTRYDDAWMRKDVAGVMRLLAPEYVYFSSRGQVSDLAATRKLLSSPGYRIENGRREKLTAYRYGSTVVVSTRWKANGVFDGKPFTDDQRCSVVVGFAGGSGRVLSEHCTNMP